MAHPDDGAISVRLDPLPGHRIVARIDAGQPDHLGARVGKMLGKPGLELGQEDVRVVEAAVDEIDLLPVEGVEPGRELLSNHLRWVAGGIEDGEPGWCDWTCY